MEAQWFKSIRANGCYDLDVLTAMPVKDDIIAHRHHDGRTTFALVCGSRPSTQHIIIKRWNTTYNEWQVGAKEYLSYTTANQYGFGCYFTHKVVPKRNNDNAQAPVVAQAPQVVERIVEVEKIKIVSCIVIAQSHKHPLRQCPRTSRTRL